VHLIFEWQNLYNKLPQPGSYYLFDPIIWLPGGGKSWSGSQGVHEASSWGHLNFNLTPKQLAEIRKQIIFSCYRSYESKKFVMKVSENRYEWWQDEELGDPEFYEECLKPLREKLQAYAKLVKPDMTDADAAEAYHAIPYWKGFKHEIDELRKNYLRQRLMKDCR